MNSSHGNKLECQKQSRQKERWFMGLRMEMRTLLIIELETIYLKSRKINYVHILWPGY